MLDLFILKKKIIKDPSSTEYRANNTYHCVLVLKMIVRCVELIRWNVLVFVDNRCVVIGNRDESFVVLSIEIVVLEERL